MTVTPGIPPIGTIARRSRTLSRDDIVTFTELSGDRNPLHYDEPVAAASRFGGIIVQGGVTSALLNAAVAEDVPGPGTVFLHVDWSFRAPARPGDTITAEVEVLTRRVDKPIGTLRTEITNQDGTVLLEGTAVVYREPLPEASGAVLDARVDPPVRRRAAPALRARARRMQPIRRPLRRADVASTSGAVLDPMRETAPVAELEAGD